MQTHNPTARMGGFFICDLPSRGNRISEKQGRDVPAFHRSGVEPRQTTFTERFGQQAVDMAFHHIAAHHRSDIFRRAGVEDVAGHQLEGLRQFADLFGGRPDHLLQIGADLSTLLPISHGFFWSPIALQIAPRHIQADRIAIHVLQRLVHRNILSAPWVIYSGDDRRGNAEPEFAAEGCSKRVSKMKSGRILMQLMLCAQLAGCAYADTGDCRPENRLDCEKARAAARKRIAPPPNIGRAQPKVPAPGATQPAPPIVAPSQPAAGPAIIGICDAGGCWDNRANRYNGGAGNTYLNSNGRPCHQVGQTMQCF